jgi:hypothetical protein
LRGLWPNIFCSPDFITRPDTVEIVHRKHCEAFRIEHGDKPIAKLESRHLQFMFARMAATPATANEWRAAMRDLLRFGVKCKVLVTKPALELKRMAANRPRTLRTISGRNDQIDNKHSGPLVYFVKIGKNAIKIGVTTNLVKRLASLKTASAESAQVVAVFPGDRGLEKRLHKLFAGSRIRNEFSGKIFLSMNSFVRPSTNPLPLP